MKMNLLMSDRKSLLVAESDEPQVVVAKVNGNITREALSVFSNPEDTLGEHAFTKKLLLNLAECGQIDSTGVGWMLQLHRRCVNGQGQLVMHSLQPTLVRIFNMLNLHTVLHIVDDERSARGF